MSDEKQHGPNCMCHIDLKNAPKPEALMQKLLDGGDLTPDERRLLVNFAGTGSIICTLQEKMLPLSFNLMKDAAAEVLGEVAITDRDGILKWLDENLNAFTRWWMEENAGNIAKTVENIVQQASAAMRPNDGKIH